MGFSWITIIAFQYVFRFFSSFVGFFLTMSSEFMQDIPDQSADITVCPRLVALYIDQIFLYIRTPKTLTLHNMAYHVNTVYVGLLHLSTTPEDFSSFGIQLEHNAIRIPNLESFFLDYVEESYSKLITVRSFRIKSKRKS